MRAVGCLSLQHGEYKILECTQVQLNQTELSLLVAGIANNLGRLSCQIVDNLWVPHVV